MYSFIQNGKITQIEQQQQKKNHFVIMYASVTEPQEHISLLFSTSLPSALVSVDRGRSISLWGIPF